ncbi:3-dehydroquinate synthase [Scopulibacillus cellulosilyticus]|uniref:3-dehydroquinate synthase n=1 Tax=Scopulibacillus cellulosilyticus TaxID=2665665 RepID=A0ABW2PQ85_9BACL
MDKLIIQTKQADYPVYIGPGLRFRLAEMIPEKYSSFYIITDDQVGRYYGDEVYEALSGFKTSIYTVQSGENAKSMNTYQEILDDMLEKQLDRRTCVIALGGGVVGDLAGFVAATYLRGVGFIQMPTTLLAHDSSVGGKVAINHKMGKNLIGAFYHPSAVIYDTETLETLSLRERRSGFAELIKHSLIDSTRFFEQLKAAIPDEAAMTPENIQPFIKEGIRVKAGIVREDERESGIRTHLNFGHTLGHAIESEFGYGRLAHGEAVAIGMVFAMHLSEHYYGHKLRTAEVSSWLEALGLPTQVPAGLSIESILHRMIYDKKTQEGRLRFVLMKEIGSVETKTVDIEEVKKVLSAFIK